MPPNKRERRPKRGGSDKTRQTSVSTSDTDHIETIPQPTVIEVTGNEEHNRDIFIDIEPTAEVEPLLVTEQQSTPLDQMEQQVDADEDQNNETQPDHNVVNFEQASHQEEPEVAISEREPDHESIGEPEINLNNDIEDEQSLSASVTRLTTPNGAEVILIGTAHFSLKSVQDVQRVIKSIRPSSVVLELCRERGFMLSLDEQSLLEQNRTFDMEKVRNAIADKGIAQGLIFIMFIKMSASLTERLGMAPGAEFRAAAKEAQKIPSCRIVLGDRSLRTTIARAVASVSLWQKMKLVYHVLTNEVNITQEEVEKCKDKDMLESLLEELGGEYPGFKRVLLDERNIYLAHSIYKWAQNSETSYGPQRVVAIVGIGHVAGIVEHWGRTSDEQVAELDVIPETSRTRKVVTKTIKYCAFALLLYAGYRILTPSHIQSAIRDKLTAS